MDHFTVDTYRVNVYPDKVKAKLGENAQFICVVSGFGQDYSVKWYADHNLDDALPTINHSHVLDVSLVQQNDSGSYYCVVTRESGVRVNTSGALKVIGRSIEIIMVQLYCIEVYFC